MATTEGIGGFLSAAAAAPATYNAAGYAALTFSDIGEATEIPEYGAEHAVVTHTPLKTGIVNKYHGELNYGSIAIPMALDLADAGQIILKAALASKDEISFRETRSDGSVQYFSGKVMSFRSAQSIGSVVPATSMVEITRATIVGP
jgi:hypothetical protein